jgi:hypothetical protein
MIVRSGGRIIFLRAEEIDWIEEADNSLDRVLLWDRCVPEMCAISILVSSTFSTT